jgi:hypothetical protein
MPLALRSSSTVRGIDWNGYRIDASEIRELRRTFFLSFGSCSFAEPVADLERIGLLRAARSRF